MATGEVTDAESLGGADMHSRISGKINLWFQSCSHCRVGVSDQLAKDEMEAIHKVREFIEHLHWKMRTPLPSPHVMGTFEEPLYAAGKDIIIMTLYIYNFLSTQTTYWASCQQTFGSLLICTKSFAA